MGSSSSCLSVVSLYSSFLRRSATAAGLTSQTVTLDGGDTTIHFWGPPSTAATSKPHNIVLIHGFGPPGLWQWHQQISSFAKDFNVYVPDLIFFGDSFTKSSDRSEVFQAICLAKTLEKLEICRYSVVGTSYGGFVAYHMAAMWPDRVEKVVISSSAVNMRPGDNDRLLKKANVGKIEDFLLPTTASQLRALLPFIIFRPPPYIPNFILHDFIDKLYSENMKEKLQLLKELTIGREDDVKLSPLIQEVLIVWGEHDQIFLLEKAMDLKGLLGEKSTLHIIKNAAHVPQLERPTLFNKILNNFLYGF